MMKKALIISVFMLWLMNATASYGQKYFSSNHKGEAIVELQDGNIHQGWFRGLSLDYVEISNEPKGKKIRYDADSISKLILLPSEDAKLQTVSDTVCYIKGNGAFKVLGIKFPNEGWFRIDYVGRGMKLFSCIIETRSQNMTNFSSKMLSQVFYGQIGDQQLQFIAGESFSSGFLTVSDLGMTRKAIVDFFKDYPEFAQRIKDKEFQLTTPSFKSLLKSKSSQAPMKDELIVIIKAWEDAYCERGGDL